MNEFENGSEVQASSDGIKSPAKRLEELERHTATIIDPQKIEASTEVDEIFPGADTQGELFGEKVQRSEREIKARGDVFYTDEELKEAEADPIVYHNAIDSLLDTEDRLVLLTAEYEKGDDVIYALSSVLSDPSGIDNRSGDRRQIKREIDTAKSHIDSCKETINNINRNVRQYQEYKEVA